MHHDKRSKKKLDEMNLLDDFLFGSVVSYPGIGEEFCALLIGIIMGREVSNLKVVPQKVYYGENTDRHGVCLDVYIEEADSGEKGEVEKGTVYDIEPDKNSNIKLKEALPKRTRYYRARMAGKGLGTGEDYGRLKETIIIMILPYDPFGLDRMVYTVRNMCVEEPALEYYDGEKTIYLYTKGKKGNPPEALKKLLQYMEETRGENAGNEELKKMHGLVETVKRDGEVSYKYMKVFEREQMLREEGRMEERANTLKEKERADKLEVRIEELEKQLKKKKC